MEVDPRTNALLDYTNDLHRLATKAQHSGLLEEELYRLQKDLDAIRRLATTTTTSSSSACLPRPSSPLDGSSPPATLGLLASSLATVDHHRHTNNTHHQRPSPAFGAESFFRPSSMTATAATFTNLSSPPRGDDHHSNLFVGNTSAGKTTPNISSININNKSPVGVIKRRNRGKNLPKDVKRCCTICKAEKTSQWRSGADGRPTLCNACGLRFRHSMKQHRQYLEGNKQLSVGHATSKDTHRNPERGRESFPELPELQRQELFEALRTHQEQLRQQRQLDLVDSADVIDECHSPLAEEHPSTRRSSIYSLLN